MSIIDELVRKIDKFMYKRMHYKLISLLSGTKYDDLYAPYIGIKKAFLLMEPEYGNLGDHAIAYASEKFIQNTFPEFKLITVTEKETCKHIKAIKKVCSQDDLIFLQGGGNMGSLYPYIERMRRFCIEEFPEQKIVSMPTSIWYTEDRKGKRELRKGLKTYNNHKSLFLLARDEYTFDFMKKNYSNANLKLVPDIVYYLADDKKKPISKDADIMICLRAEGESAIGTGKRSEIIRYLNDAFEGRILIHDTTVWRNISKDMRDLEIKSLLRQFSKAKCVVTDRLHGMILSAIAGTPAVALRSRDGKIPGGYFWINKAQYIRLIDSSNPEEIAKHISSLEKLNYAEDISYVREGFIGIRRFILADEGE